ncbi:MAG: hypothetical protein GYA86_06025 [Firmicutes bacterium]|jgi:hypothetical protein|nr:hypothetical protein [Bacillota bacterium]
MAKRSDRGQQQNKELDPRKVEKYREEAARELAVELPGKDKKKVPQKKVPQGNTPTYRSDDR